MTKKEAVERYVERELSSVPQEWVRIVMESENEYRSLPMWGTMWIVNKWDAEKLLDKSRMMVYDKDEIDLDSMEDDERKLVEKAIEDDDWPVLEDYIDEEMSGERCVLDKDGHTTNIFVYEVLDEIVIGVHGAGYDFYDGVWDRLYDTLGFNWHSEALPNKEEDK